MARKAEGENELRSRIATDPKKKETYGAAWERIAEAQKTAARLVKPFNFLERGFAFDSDLFRIARTLVRLAEEKPKPNSDRLREYRDSGLQSLELHLFSEAPIYPEYEEAKLAHALAYWKKNMPDHPLIERVLRGRSARGGRPRFCPRLQAGRYRGEEEAGRGWQGRDREVRRPDDQAGTGR